MMPSTAPPVPLILAFVLFFAVRDARAAPSFCDAQPGWKLDWLEEFDGVALNASSWSALDLQTYDIGCCRDAACLPDNVLVAGGALHLSSERRRVEGYNFTTGAVRTKGKRSWTATAASAFRVCVSASLPGGGHGADGAAQGIWPAHWMMPDTEGCWPDLGEMDILEMINGDGRAHATYHWDANYPAKNCTQVHLRATASSFKYRCLGEYCGVMLFYCPLSSIHARSQPDGHKLHGSYMNMTTWDTQFHEYAVARAQAEAARPHSQFPSFSLFSSGMRSSEAPSTWLSFTTECCC